MGLFDIFSSKNSDKAAQDKIAGLNDGYDKATTALNAGTATANDYYGKALVPFNQLFGAGMGGVDSYSDALGVNGPEGNARATAAFQNNPGYQTQLQYGRKRSTAARRRAVACRAATRSWPSRNTGTTSPRQGGKATSIASRRCFNLAGTGRARYRRGEHDRRRHELRRRQGRRATRLESRDRNRRRERERRPREKSSVRESVGRPHGRRGLAGRPRRVQAGRDARRQSDGMGLNTWLTLSTLLSLAVRRRSTFRRSQSSSATMSRGGRIGATLDVMDAFADVKKARTVNPTSTPCRPRRFSLATSPRA
jgi:hypothetical protein